MTVSLAEFTSFVRNVMGISPAVLPNNSPIFQSAYDFALEIVSTTILSVSPKLYEAAVYNLAGDNLINYAPDVSGAPNVDGSEPPAPYFKYTRRQFNIGGFVSGVIQSSGDEGTNESLVVQKAAEDFTLADLQHLKTPYGRQYLAIAQQTGTLWGLT